jgi:hypothetical protein
MRYYSWLCRQTGHAYRKPVTGWRRFASAAVVYIVRRSTLSRRQSQQCTGSTRRDSLLGGVAEPVVLFGVVESASKTAASFRVAVLGDKTLPADGR